MESLLNLDLISVGITTAAICILGFVLFFSDRSSTTSRSFLALSLMASAWSFLNFLSYRVTDPVLGLWLCRLVMFSAVWFAYFVCKTFYFFPNEKTYSPRLRYPLVGLTWATSLLTLTPFVFARVSSLTPQGTISSVESGWGIALFGAVVLGLNIGGLILLFSKTKKVGGITKRAFGIILFGAALTLFSILSFNFFLPALFDISDFVPFGAFFIFPFIAATFYAIYRHGVLNIKVISTELLIFVLAVSILFEVVYADSLVLLAFRVGIFLLVLTIGILLIRSVLKEVEQRMKIQIQEEELAIANDRQAELMHFITHEVKGYLTKNQAAFAAIVEGDYGQVGENMKNMTSRALQDTRKGVDTVIEILSASNMKKGTVAYTSVPFDLHAEVAKVVADLTPVAKEKKLSFEFIVDGSANYAMVGDAVQIGKHVIANIINNAIIYTPSGYVRVKLSRSGNILRLSVEDSGVGLSEDDKKNLFTEGGRGKDSIKINTHSTGYGLFIARSIVEAHHGRLWAESAGPGKGSTFIVELPAKN